MEWFVLLAPLFAMVFGGVFVFVALGVTAFVVYYFLAGGAQSMMGAAVWDSIQMYALVAVGCFILVGALYGRLTWRDIAESVKESTHTFCILLLVVCGAMLLAKSAALIGLPRSLSLYIGGLDVGPTTVMIGLIVMYLLLGCLFDGISFMVMTLPFVFPIVTDFGFGGVWFAVVLVVLIEIGQLTPPVGLNLYVIQAIAGGDATLEEVVKGLWPFFWILTAFVAVLILFPQMATLLPKMFGFDVQ